MKSGEVKTQDFFYPIGPCAGSPAGSQLVWDYFKNNFEYLKDKLKTASPSLLAAVIVNSVNFCSNERAQEVEAFFEANPVPQCSRRIAQLLEGMRNAGAMLENVRATKLATAAFWQ